MFKAKNAALAIALMGVSSFVVAGPNTTNGTITFNGTVEGECGFHHSHASGEGTLGMTPSGEEPVWGDPGTIRYVNNTDSEGLLYLSDESDFGGIAETNLRFKVEGAATGEQSALDWQSNGVALTDKNGNSSHDEINVKASVVDSSELSAGTHTVVSVWTVDCNAE